MIVPEFRTGRGARQLPVEAVYVPEYGCICLNNLLKIWPYVMAGDHEPLNGSHELLVMVM